MNAAFRKIEGSETLSAYWEYPDDDDGCHAFLREDDGFLQIRIPNGVSKKVFCLPNGKTVTVTVE